MMKYSGPKLRKNLLPFSHNFIAKGGFIKIDKIKRVIDGDTFECIINNEIESIRFYSVNTLELTLEDNSLALKAKEYVEKRINEAKTIFIQSDNNAKVLRDSTQKRRILAWVWLDNQLLNYELVKLGLAEVVYYQDVNGYYLHALEEANDFAKKNKLGIYEIK